MQVLRRIALCAITLVVGVMTAVMVAGSPAVADTGGYPYASTACVWSPYATSGTGNWCKKLDADGHITSEYDWGTIHDNTSYSSELSPYGYYYRNCTDYVAWKLSSLGVQSAQYRGLGNAKAWASPPAGNGLRVDTTPAPGSAAVSTSGTFGHVAFVEQVVGVTITVSEYNYAEDGAYHTRSGTAASLGFTAFVHFEQYESSPPNASAPPSPGAISVLTHGSRVNLSWGGSSGATSYQVSRNGAVIATVGGTTLLDIAVSPGQDYTYSVAAINGNGQSNPVTRYVPTSVEAGDRAYLQTKDGPALCGRTGDQTHQSVDCTVLKSTGWVTVYAPNYDWGYSADRTWLTNADGTVSYCRRVNFGDQVACDRFDGTTWTSSTSPRTDLAYAQDRAYLSTKDGPAVCGRTGDQSSQTLDCTVLKSTGWVTVYAPANDWGYATDRTWLTNADGTVSYCRRVNFADQVTCDRFDGTTWTSATSPRTDLAYGDNRAYLSTKDGPAVCGRTGDQSSQTLDCTVLKSTGWVTVYTPAGDWGYATDRSWLTNADGTVSYCRRVNFADQVTCDRFDGTAWTSSTSPRTDLAYGDNRAYLSTKDGPAVCGRTGDQSSQTLDCTVLKSTGWVTVYTPAGDWGYATDRSWLTNADGTVSFCRRVNFADQVTCDRFDGTAWTSSTSPRTDLGYPDTF